MRKLIIAVALAEMLATLATLATGAPAMAKAQSGHPECRGVTPLPPGHQHHDPAKVCDVPLPETTITSYPPVEWPSVGWNEEPTYYHFLKDDTPTFEFTSDTGTSFECYTSSLTEGGWRPCASPFTPYLPELTDELNKSPLGTQYNVEVRAVSVSGVPDPTPELIQFYVDTTEPTTEIIEPEPGTVITDPERDYAHKFASDASPYAHYKCTITGPNGWTQEYGVTECGEIGGFRLPYDGAYEMQVWARDYAGNLDSTPAVVNFTVDTTVP